jgi:hypothetical protein
MKTCSKCLESKAFTEFFIKYTKTGRLHAQCKSCHKKYRQTYYKAHYARYRENYLKRAKHRRQTIKSALRKKMLEYLSNKYCEICGFDDIRTLDFDHIDPSVKNFSISRGMSDCLSWDDILKEIKKCRILCANCHKIRTAEQFNWYRKARWPRS